MTGFLVLFISTGPTVQNQGSGNLNFNNTGYNINLNGSVGIGGANFISGSVPKNQGNNCIGQAPSNCSGDYTCANTNSAGDLCLSTASTGLTGQTNCLSFNTNPISGITNPLSSLESIPSLVWAGLQSLAKFGRGNGFIAPNPIQCNGVGTAQGAFQQIGEAITGTTSANINSGSISGLIEQTIAIISIVGAVAIGLSVLGDGQSALYVGVAGIGVALIYFMQSILGSTVFIGTPIWIMGFVDAISSAMYIWIILTLLRS